MKLGVAEAVAAYNSDVNEEGVSPLQAVTGRQQPAQGDVLAGVGNRLAEHSLLENKPSLARQVALRETARVCHGAHAFFPEACAGLSWPERDQRHWLTFLNLVTFAIFGGHPNTTLAAKTSPLTAAESWT